MITKVPSLENIHCNMFCDDYQCRIVVDKRPTNRVKNDRLLFTQQRDIIA